MEATDRFEAVVSCAPDVLALDQAVLLIAAHDHPVDHDAQLARLDALASRCQPASLPALAGVLFEDEGFAGDEDDYHHPDNSFLDRVLERRRGLPILLSVLTAEVAARAGLCLAPVGMPGHFLVRECGSDVFVDPFHRGRILDRDDCRRIFTALHPGQPFDDRYLEPVDNRAVLVRILTNLVQSYTQRGPVASLAWTTHLRAILVGGEAWLPVARLRERTGEWHLAADAWDRLADSGRRGAATAPARAAAARARAN